MVLTVAVSVWAARHHPGRWMRAYALALALVILAAWVGEYVADAVLGIWAVKYTLPLQLTDAVSAAAVLALLSRRRLLIELTYFWAFTASLQAVLTPDLAQIFPSIFYFTYFTYHVGAIVAASFLVFGCRLYPRAGAVGRVYAITFAFTVLVAAADLLTGGNYMYLRDKPAHSSLLNLMGSWPWYIVETAALAFLMLVCLAGLARAVRAVADPSTPTPAGPVTPARPRGRPQHSQ